MILYRIFSWKLFLDTKAHEYDFGDSAIGVSYWCTDRNFEFEVQGDRSRLSLEFAIPDLLENLYLMNRLVL